MRTSLWDDNFVIKAYELARGGFSSNSISKMLGISIATYHLWLEKKRLFKYAITRGRKIFNGEIGSQPVSFRDYVYGRLTEPMKKVWDRINQFEKAKCGVEQIEAILTSAGKNVRQHLFIYAWIANNFNVSAALRAVNLSRDNFDAWRRNDPDFMHLVEEIDWHKKNFFEEGLVKLIRQGDTQATIFANRTYNRDRGYHEKIEVDQNIKGTITHNMNVISIDKLGLDLPTKKKILQGIRGYKNASSRTTESNSNSEEHSV